MDGVLFSFEGIDLCGKGTQIGLLDTYLSEQGIEHVVSREPGGTALGEAMRKLLKRPDASYSALNAAFYGNSDFADSPLGTERTAEAEVLMFLVGRRQFYAEIIVPNLARGVTVIADRFMDSTTAYQGYGRLHGNPQSLDFIARSHNFLLDGRLPDVTFVIDIPVEEMARRRATAEGRDPEDVFEKLNRDFFERVRQGYAEIARDSARRFCLVDGTLPREEIFERYIRPELNAQLLTRRN